MDRESAVVFLSGVRTGFGAFGGTLKDPRVTIYSEPAMSQNRALHYIVTGRPPGEGTGADGNLLSKAASSIGLRGGNLLAR